MSTMPREVSREKRSIHRRPVGDTSKVEFRMALPFPKGTTLIKSVLDISERGLAFVMDSEEGHFLPATPLGDCTIVEQQKQFRVSAKVIYSKPIGTDGRSRVGVQFTSDVRKRSLALHRQLDYQVRSLRYDASSVGMVECEFSCVGGGRSALVGRVANFSPFGLAVELPGETDSVEPGMLLTLKVRANSEVVYSGMGAAVYKLRSGDISLVGVSLSEGPLDVQRASGQKRRRELAETVARAIRLEGGSSSLPVEFRAEVSDLRNLFERLKSTLDEEEKRIRERSRPSVIECRGLVDSVEREAVTVINSALRRIGSLVGELGKEEHEMCRRYFQTSLHPVLLLSPFFKRAYQKPLGYAGDFEIVNMLLRNADEGDTLFAKVLSRQGCGLPVAQAHRNRIAFLADQINTLLRRRRDDMYPVRVMSIGCGPSQEVVDVIMANPDSARAEFTLIDFDPEALSYCHNALSLAKARTKRPVRVNILNRSVRDLIRDARRGGGLGEFDLIYCAGLYDYLTPDACSRLTQISHSWLKPTGQLIVTNVSSANEYRTFMEYGLEWFVFHRSRQDLEAIAFAAGIPLPVTVESDQTGTNLFLRVVK